MFVAINQRTSARLARATGNNFSRSEVESGLPNENNQETNEYRKLRRETKDELEELKCEIQKVQMDTKNLFSNLANIRILVQNQQDELNKLLHTQQQKGPISDNTFQTTSKILFDHSKSFQQTIEKALALIGVVCGPKREVIFQPQQTELENWCSRLIKEQMSNLFMGKANMTVNQIQEAGVVGHNSKDLAGLTKGLTGLGARSMMPLGGGLATGSNKDVPTPTLGNLNPDLLTQHPALVAAVAAAQKNAAQAATSGMTAPLRNDTRPLSLPPRRRRCQSKRQARGCDKTSTATNESEKENELQTKQSHPEDEKSIASVGDFGSNQGKFKAPVQSKGLKRQRSESDVSLSSCSTVNDVQTATKNSRSAVRSRYADEMRSYMAARRYPRRSSKQSEESSDSDGDDDDEMCDVCMKASSKEEPLLKCLECQVLVHQECYGIKKVPKKGWICFRCKSGVSQSSAECSLCLHSGGAMMVMDKGSEVQTWAHVQCAWWDPDTEVVDGPDDQAQIKFKHEPKKARAKLNCYLCKKPKGLCIQCAYPNCYSPMHTRCASDEGYLDMDFEFNTLLKIPFCRRHAHIRSFSGDIIKKLKGFVNECQQQKMDEKKTEAMDTIGIVLQEASSGAFDAKKDGNVSWEDVQKQFKSFETCVTMIMDCLVESKLIIGNEMSSKRHKIDTLLRVLMETLRWEWRA